MEMIDYRCQIKEEVKGVQSEIKENIQGTNSDGKETDSNQQFGAQGRNTHSSRTE